MYAGAQKASLPALGEHLVESGANMGQPRSSVLKMQLVNFFLREIQHRLGQGTKLRQLRHERIDRGGELARKRAQRRACRFSARRVDEIRNRLCLRKIELAFEISAPREFPGIGDARPRV